MPDNPLSFEFWRAEAGKLWDAANEAVMLSLIAGASSGVDLLPKEVAGIVNWNVFNSAAIEYLNNYNLTTLYGISETTRKQVARAINQWILSGQPLSVLENTLAPIFGDLRAAQIAATEVTRIFAEGNQLAWMSSGVVTGNRWQTARDERVCFICGPLHGQLVGLNENAFGGAGGLSAPPAHVGCLTGDALVLPVGKVAAGSERFFEGDVVVLKTPKYNLTVTPNHPILTPRGWVGAGALNKGDKIWCYGSSEWERLTVNMDNVNVVSSIKQIFSSLDLSGFRMPTTAPDFHGDGANSKVAVIRPNREVVDGDAPVLSQVFSQLLLGFRDVVQGSVARLSAVTQFGEISPAPFGGAMGGRDLSGSPGGTHLSPLESFGLRTITGGHTFGNKKPVNRTPASPYLEAGVRRHLNEFFSESKDALSTQVELQEVVGNDRVAFSGHVYNLQTESEWYVANGIITHNCRCWLQPFVDPAAFEENLLKELQESVR